MCFCIQTGRFLALFSGNSLSRWLPSCDLRTPAEKGDRAILLSFIEFDWNDASKCLEITIFRDVEQGEIQAIIVQRSNEISLRSGNIFIRSIQISQWSKCSKQRSKTQQIHCIHIRVSRPLLKGFPHSRNSNVLGEILVEVCRWERK